MWSQGRVTALAASRYCWEKPDRNGETIFCCQLMGKQHLGNASYLGIFFLQMPCNTPVLLPLLVCALCIKNYYLLGHYLLCLMEGHPKRAPWPQHAPLSQTLIGDRFHQVLKRNSPDTARWQRIQGVSSDGRTSTSYLPQHALDHNSWRQGHPKPIFHVTV